jgi:hypothetical protein
MLKVANQSLDQLCNIKIIKDYFTCNANQKY